jgi:hypothetical protein
LRKGHRDLPAKRFEAHDRPLHPIYSLVEKSSGFGNEVTASENAKDRTLPNQSCRSILQSLLTTSKAIGEVKLLKRIGKTGSQQSQLTTT